MIDQYAQWRHLNLDATVYQTYMEILHRFYQPFRFNIVYFATIGSAIMILLAIFIYLVCRQRLQMPRSFYHIKLNIWLCLLVLMLIYTLGINQIDLPHLCWLTGISLHYLTLATFIWHTLYFYALLHKLQTLEKRNFGLIFGK